MNENPVSDEHSVTDENIVTNENQEAPLPAKRSLAVRRLLITVLPAVLVLGAVGGGLAYTKHTVDNADRTVTTTLWGQAERKPAEDPAGAADRGRTDTPLSRTLLPVPEGYRLGPDIASYGNDDELSAKQATALLKSAGDGFSGKERREFEKQIDRLGLQGFAMRSYSSDIDDLVVEVNIGRMKNKKAIHDWYERQIELYEAVDVFRKGPAVEGHKKATCYLLPKPYREDENGEREKVDLDAMRCMAYDGDLFVTVTAYGTTPFDKTAAAELVKDQLDHIASPGEYV